MTVPPPSDDLADAADRVRRFLLEVGFTADGVLSRLGSAAFAALGRGLAVPTRRVLAAGPASDLDRMIAAFLLGDRLPHDALAEGVVADLAALGMVRAEPDGLVPTVEVHPYGEPDTDWYLVSDVGAPQRPDHVLGLGGASLTLARITPRRDVGRALDLGCGAGVQVLHAARHVGRVVATDTNPRALAMTRLSAALSGVPAASLDLREGSLFAPVADERFDLIVSNPPFVVSPSHRFTYRDAGLTGDELSRLVVRGAAAHLAPGGLAAVLGNWLHVTGEQWTERVAGWVAGTGVDAWIVQRDSQAVADYAATWLREADEPSGGFGAGGPGGPGGRGSGAGEPAASEPPGAGSASGQAGPGPSGPVRPHDAGHDDGPGAGGAGPGDVPGSADVPGPAVGPGEGRDPAGHLGVGGFDAALGEWLDAFAGEGAEAVGFGWVVLVAPPVGSPPREPWVLVEDLTSSERLPRGDEVLAFLAGCEALRDLAAPAMLASRARLADAATVTTTTHHSGGSHVDAPPQLGLAGVVGAGGWRPALTVHPAVLAALLADPATPIGERLDAAALAEGLDPLDVLGPALMGLRELVRVGIVRTD